MQLSAAPWIVRHAPSGQAEGLSIRSDLAWVRDIGVQADGSLLVAGEIETADTGYRVQVQQLSATGELLSSTVLPNAPAEQATFAGMASASDGRFYLAMYVTYPEQFWDVFELYALTVSGAPEPLPTVNASRPEVPLAVEFIAADAAGTFAYGGGFDGSVEVQIGGRHYEIVSAFTTGHLGALIPDGRGGWFVSTGDGWTNRISGLGRYHHTLIRFDSTGQELWRAGDEFDPEVFVNDTAFHATSVAVLTDSVIMCAPHGAFEAAGVMGRAARYKFDGSIVQAFFEAEQPRFTAAVGPHAAVFLKQGDPDYTLVRVDLEPLTIQVGSAGAPCSAGQDCGSGLCCFPSGAGLGACSGDSTCDLGARCDLDVTCGAGACYRPSDATQGSCVARCQSSSDCPANTFCIDGVCLASCTPMSACDNESMSCVEQTNAEAIAVFVCSYP